MVHRLVRPAWVAVLSDVRVYAVVWVWHTSHGPHVPPVPFPGWVYEPAAYPARELKVTDRTLASVRFGMDFPSLPALESVLSAGALIPLRSIMNRSAPLFPSPCGSWQSTHFHGEFGQLYFVPVIPRACVRASIVVVPFAALSWVARCVESPWHPTHRASVLSAQAPVNPPVPANPPSVLSDAEPSRNGSFALFEVWGAVRAWQT